MTTTAQTNLKRGGKYILDKTFENTIIYLITSLHAGAISALDSGLAHLLSSSSGHILDFVPFVLSLL